MRDSSFTYTVLFAKYTLNVIVLREQFKRRYIKSKFVYGHVWSSKWQVVREDLLPFLQLLAEEF